MWRGSCQVSQLAPDLKISASPQISEDTTDITAGKNLAPPFLKLLQDQGGNGCVEKIRRSPRKEILLQDCRGITGK